MHLKEVLIKLLKSLGGDIRQTIVSVVVIGALSVYGGLLLLSNAVLNYSIQLLTMSTPLWATILLILLGYIYIYLKLQKIKSLITSSQRTLSQDNLNNLTLKFGIYWDKNKQAHCPTCKTPLSQYKEEQRASGNFYSYFICPKCRLPVYLQNDEAPITIQQAIKHL